MTSEVSRATEETRCNLVQVVTAIRETTRRVRSELSALEHHVTSARTSEYEL